MQPKILVDLRTTKIRAPNQQQAHDDFPAICVMSSENNLKQYDVVLGAKKLLDAKKQKTKEVEVYLLESHAIPLNKIKPTKVLDNVVLSDALLEKHQRNYETDPHFMPVLARASGEDGDDFELVYGINQYRTALYLGHQTLPVILVPTETIEDRDVLIEHWDNLALLDKIHTVGESYTLHNATVLKHYRMLKETLTKEETSAIVKDKSTWRSHILSCLEASVIELIEQSSHAEDKPIVAMLQPKLLESLAPTLAKYADELAHPTFEYSRLKRHMMYAQCQQTLTTLLEDYLSKKDLSKDFSLKVESKEKKHYLFPADLTNQKKHTQETLELHAVNYYLNQILGAEKTVLYKTDYRVKARLKRCEHIEIPDFLFEILAKNPQEKGTNILNLLMQSKVKLKLAKHFAEAVTDQLDIALHEDNCPQNLAENTFDFFTPEVPKKIRPPISKTQSTLMQNAIGKLIEEGFARKFSCTTDLKSFMRELKRFVEHGDFLKSIEFKISTALRDLRADHYRPVPRLADTVHTFDEVDSAEGLLAQLKFTEFACKRFILSNFIERLSEAHHGVDRYPLLHPRPSYKHLMALQDGKPQNDRIPLIPEDDKFHDLVFIYRLKGGHSIVAQVFISKYGLMTYKVLQFQTYLESIKAREDGAYYRLKSNAEPSDDDTLCRLIKDNLNLSEKPVAGYPLDFSKYLKLFIFCLVYIEGMRNPASFVTHVSVLNKLLASERPDKLFKALDDCQFPMTAKGATSHGRDLHEKARRITRGNITPGEHYYRFFNSNKELREAEIQATKDSDYTPNTLVEKFYALER